MTVTCDRASEPRHFAAADAAGLDLPNQLRSQVDATLQALLPTQDLPPVNLHGAMRYAVLSPGKRLRPLLTLLAAGDDTTCPTEALHLACVAELVHAASLILDDLPCMDDAKLRRSQPCTHLLYSESTAILAAVNLLNLAFGVIARCPGVAPELRAATTAHLSDVVGSSGLVGGQIADLQNLTKTVERSAIERLYQQKTGGLFEFALVTGGRLRGLTQPQLQALARCAEAFGLWFQVQDDLLDQLASPQEAGKDVGKDGDKATLIALHSPGELQALLAKSQGAVREQLVAAGLGHSKLFSFVEAQFAAVAMRTRASGASN